MKFNWDDCCLRVSMKRKASCAIISLMIAGSARSQTRIVADISNLRSDKGVCRACLFNNAASFNGDGGQPFQCVTVQVKNDAAQAVFNDIPRGTYAIFVFHDANSNNKMDRNFLGIPREGYGASRNKLPFASAPTFTGNKFETDNLATIKLQIKIRNL